MNYEKDTRTAYDQAKAEIYKRQQTEGFSWIRLTTWREKLLVKRCLGQCGLEPSSVLLDIPCGTGVLGSVFAYFPSKVFASDISDDMMALAKNEYRKETFGGFVKTDIMQTSFSRSSFACVVTIGLMHRLPLVLRRKALGEISALTSRYIVLSDSVDSPMQRLKRRLLAVIRSGYRSAPSPMPLRTILEEIDAKGLRVKQIYAVVPFLSSEMVFLLEKTVERT